MTWLVWRQHRVQYLVGAALLAAFAVMIVVTGEQVSNQFHSAQAACAVGHGCRNLGGLFMGSHVVGFLVIATLGTPVLVGLFWGAPLVAAEAEAGTTQFAWMQSVTRKRWLAVKIGWMLLAAAIWGGVISALVTWWASPTNAEQLNQFDPGRFDIMGLVPVGYSLFAVALGITAGALLRRTLPAIAVTLAGFVAVRVVITLWLRSHYISAVTVTYNVLSGYTPKGAYWQLASGVLGPNGQPLAQPNNTAYFDGVPQTYLPGACSAMNSPSAPNNPPPACLQALSRFHAYLTYQPGDRFWAFQGIETGIFVALAAALITVTAVTLLRRDA
jgi:ABC-type transport system involved in multi-copper enzyme maturation permease subunit